MHRCPLCLGLGDVVGVRDWYPGCEELPRDGGGGLEVTHHVHAS